MGDFHSSTALIRYPDPKLSIPRTHVAKAEELVDLVRVGIYERLATKGLHKEDADGKELRWLKHWGASAIDYLETQLPKIAIADKDFSVSRKRIFAAAEFEAIRRCLQDLVDKTSPHKYYSAPDLPYPRKFPLIGIISEEALEMSGVTGKMSVVMALLMLFQIKRVVFFKDLRKNYTQYTITDTETYLRRSNDRTFVKLEQAVLAKWKKESTSREIQRRIYEDLVHLDEHLWRNESNGIESRADRLKRLLDENLEVAAWQNSIKNMNGQHEHPVPKLELHEVGLALYELDNPTPPRSASVVSRKRSKSAPSLAHFVSQRRRDMYHV